MLCSELEQEELIFLILFLLFPHNQFMSLVKLIIRVKGEGDVGIKADEIVAEAAQDFSKPLKQSKFHQD
jgi:hypothetical protein